MPRNVDYGKRATTVTRCGFGLCLVLLLGGMGCATKFVGTTVPSGYRFAVLPPISIVEHQSQVIVVRVQDAQGQPVDGVPVTFQVDPSWVDNTSVVPARTTTRAGEAHAVFRAGLVGRVPIKIVVENTPYEVTITVSGRNSYGAI